MERGTVQLVTITIGAMHGGARIEQKPRFLDPELRQIRHCHHLLLQDLSLLYQLHMDLISFSIMLVVVIAEAARENVDSAVSLSFQQ